MAEFVDAGIFPIGFLYRESPPIEFLLKPPGHVIRQPQGVRFLDRRQQFRRVTGVFFCGGQPNGDRGVSIRARLRELITLARFFPEDAVVHALRFLIDNAGRFHVALQGGTASAPLGAHGPLVVFFFQLQVVHLVGTALPEIQLCSFNLHSSLLRVFGFALRATRSGA